MKHNHNHKIEISEKVAFLAPLLAIFMHIFCCGIPITLAILSGVFGMAVNLPFFEESEHAEIFIFGFSAALLIVSYILYFTNKGCCKDCCETHRKRKFYNKIILITATVLFTISSLAHLLGHQH